MNLEEYNYDLPKELIAQVPILNRDESKLLVLDKDTGGVEHKTFKDINSYLDENTVLVLNDTKVIPARLIGEKEETKAMIELLLLKDLGENMWECLSRPTKRLHLGTIVSFGNGLLKVQILDKFDEGIVKVKLIYEGILMEILEKLGTMPLPPYIKEKLDDQSRYQTVYAKNLGSAAAPTAGLHFTNELLESLKNKGVTICYVTLHVGLGTFRPVEVENILQHHMHSEYYEMNLETANILNEARRTNKNIVAVGTTTTRVLETIASKYDSFRECSGNTDIFIYPGYNFKGIDSLITNFHLPKSTLLMLVSALAGKENIMNAYDSAIKNNYRFFSFGDAMLIKAKNK